MKLQAVRSNITFGDRNIKLANCHSADYKNESLEDKIDLQNKPKNISEQMEKMQKSLDKIIDLLWKINNKK